MPLIQVSLVQGRDVQTVKRFIKAVAHTAHETLGAPLETIRVIVNELPATHWAVGDQTRDDIDAAKRAAAEAAQAAQAAKRIDK